MYNLKGGTRKKLKKNDFFFDVAPDHNIGLIYPRTT